MNRGLTNAGMLLIGALIGIKISLISGPQPVATVDAEQPKVIMMVEYVDLSAQASEGKYKSTFVQFDLEPGETHRTGYGDDMRVLAITVLRR